MAERKIIIGILGGPGSGKSRVAARLAGLGCAVVDADRIAHQLLDNDEIKGRLISVFGAEICRGDGQIDRDKLGERVFQDENSVQSVNEIVHPPVLAHCQELIEQFQRREDVKIIVLDMPLLMEVGWADKCDKLIFVDCKGRVRAQRAQEKGPLYKKQLKKREKFQISLDTKAKIADYTVSNHSDASVMTEQVDRIFTIINKESV